MVEEVQKEPDLRSFCVLPPSVSTWSQVGSMTVADSGDKVPTMSVSGLCC